MQLSDCFTELMTYVLHFRVAPDRQRPSAEKVSAEISRLMGKSAQAARECDIPDTEYEAARFAVCAWIDEVILGSSWSERSEWLKEQLQRRYYHTFDAGEEFFLRLQELEPRQRQAREVFLLCLGLGFTGRYCSAGDAERLEGLKSLQWQLYTGGNGEEIDCAAIFPELFDSRSPQEGTRQRRPLETVPELAAILGPLFLFLLLFFVFKFTLGGVAANMLRNVP